MKIRDEELSFSEIVKKLKSDTNLTLGWKTVGGICCQLYEEDGLKFEALHPTRGFIVQNAENISKHELFQLTDHSFFFFITE